MVYLFSNRNAWQQQHNNRVNKISQRRRQAFSFGVVLRKGEEILCSSLPFPSNLRFMTKTLYWNERQFSIRYLQSLQAYTQEPNCDTLLDLKSQGTSDLHRHTMESHRAQHHHICSPSPRIHQCTAILFAPELSTSLSIF